MRSGIDVSRMSIEEIVGEAIRRETALEGFYKLLVERLGPDASPILNRLYRQHRERIAQLECLVLEMRELRELTAPIAD